MIFSVVDGQFRQYKGARDLNSLMTFIEDKKWQGIEPVSALSKPDSIQMGVVSYFFKLSHYMKVRYLFFLFLIDFVFILF